MAISWTVGQDAAGERLDVFLARMLPEMTRSQIAKRIKAGAVVVNNKAATVHKFLKEGDIVAFDAEQTVSREGTRRIAPIQGEAPLLDIIEETPEWIVVNKQAGVVVHPDATHASGTLVDALVAHDPKIAKIGEDPERPGIMHRLDKETSGLMVVAKTQDAFDSLKNQFIEHTIDKRYIALVYGEMEKEEGDIKFRIAHSKTRQRMAARPEHEEIGKAAWTHYQVLKRFRNASLLELSIFSGRTHQIRAHLLAMNHPVIGDPLYKRRAEDRNINAPRLMLQSVHLGFVDPTTGTKKEFDLPPEPEFDAVMKQLG